MTDKPPEEKSTESKEEKSDNMWLGIGIGLIVGGILVAIYIKSRPPPTTTPASFVQSPAFPNIPQVYELPKSINS
jgi:hypothetical protein